jgi:hypothetical protein
MKNFKIAGLLVTGLMGVAMAGSKYNGTGNVSITQNDDGSGYALAYLGHIYNGPSVTQWFGCQAGANGNVMCHARHEQVSPPIVVGCSVKSTFLAQSVASISPDTRVAFYWDANGTCTRISVVHSSEFQDKQG